MKTFLTTALATFVLGPTAHATLFERPDGVRFDSEVGAACGALSTAVHFQALEGEVDLYDHPVLDHLATCLTHGPLRGVSIAVLGHGDLDLPDGVARSLGSERAHAVRNYLISQGVPATQVEAWGVGRGDASDHAEVGFRITDPAVTIEGRPVASR